MQSKVREDGLDWDDVPAKVVGRRRQPGHDDPTDHGLQTIAHEMNGGPVAKVAVQGRGMGFQPVIHGLVAHATLGVARGSRKHYAC